ncbi:MAG TPA: glycosyltransferase [Acidimicrobiales bacterium]|nr:glycosyltransferase [Acidimicrobiales bacterium]
MREVIERAGATGRAGASPGGRLRVVHVIDSLAGSGGAENRLVDEVVALAGRFDQTVVRLFERDFLDDRLAGAGVPVVALGFTAGRAGRTWPLVAHRLTGVLRGLRPDVVHTSLFTGNLVGQLAGARLRVPVVSTFNRTGESDLQRALQPGVASWKGRVMQAVGRAAARRGDVHHRAVGDYARRTNCASMRLPLEAATVVPRGVAVGDVGGDRAAFDLPDGVPLFANVARLVPEKAQHLLVEAFADVRRQLPGARLAIAGAAGPATPAVTAAIERAGLGDAVALLGFRDDARALVAVADVFAFSSLSEGSPGAVVEAMMLGTPVAAFAIPPVAELTGGDAHGWLADPGDPAALAAAMVAAHRAPDRAERAAAAQAWAAQASRRPRWSGR